MKRRSCGRGRRLAAGLLLLAVLPLGACRGENLFSLTGTVAGTEPRVLITAPGAGGTIATGDSILILAEITAQEGLTTIDYRGEYADSIGGDAYVSERESGGGSTFVRVNNRLVAVVDQVPGEVYIVVEATDLAGAQGKDSVKVTILN
jgi:hypothetical protein